MTDTNQTSEAQYPSLGLSDLQTLIQVIKVASDRGAFKAEELSTVGAVYDKLALFVEASMPAEDNDEQSQGEESND